MTTSNAREFLERYVYGNETREEELRQIEGNEEIIKRIVQMGSEESWPTGNFSGDDVKAVGDEHARLKGLNPPTFEMVLDLFKQGDIGRQLW